MDSCVDSKDHVYNTQSITVDDINLSDVTRRQLTNGFVYQLFLKAKKDGIKWRDIQNQLSKNIEEVADISEITLRNACENVKKKRSKLQKQANFSSELSKYFGTLFTVPVPSASSLKRKRCTDEETPCPKKLNVTFNDEAAAVAKRVNSSLLKNTVDLHDQVASLSREVRQQGDIRRELENSLGKKCDLIEEIKRKQQNKSDQRRLKEKITRKSTQAKRWRQHYIKLKNQETEIRTLEERVLKLKNDADERKEHIKTVKRQTRQAEANHEEEVARLTRGAQAVLKEKTAMVQELSSLKSAVSASEVHNTELRDELDEVKSLLNQPDADVLATKIKRTYDDRMRQCVYYCLAKEVPVTNVSDVIGYVVETMTEKKLQSLPSTASVCRMEKEMNVLSDLQTFDAIGDGNVTLSFDGTTKKERHLNEIHLSTEDNKTLCVGMGELPGGKAIDYHDHITEAMDDLVQTASEFHKTNKELAKEAVTSKITGVVTDRCIVNHAVVDRLAETYKHDLIEMKCNVHPLDSVASKAGKALKEFDGKQDFKSRTFGNYCAAINMIQAICKLRFKNGKGDPKGMKMFFQRKGLSAGLLQRFVGNRIHIVFHLAGAIFTERDILLEYLQFFCPVLNSLRSAVLEDLLSAHITGCLQVLGIFGKLLTGPWMTLLYGNTQGLTNLEVGPLFVNVLANLNALQSQSNTEVKDKVKDLFGQPLNLTDDPVTQQLFSTPIPDTHVEALRMVASEVHTVLSRQLADYIEREPTQEELTKTKSAPVHNMASEQVLGMTDQQINRAPNASPEFIQAKVKYKKNQTGEWLEKKVRRKNRRWCSMPLAEPVACFLLKRSGGFAVPHSSNIGRMKPK